MMRQPIRQHCLFTCPPVALALALAALAGGCASLNPKPDIDRAAATVQERSGYSADWTAPWSDGFEAWDGISPLAADQAIVTALKNNRRIRADVESIAAGRADLVQAGLLPNPVVSLTLRFPFDPVSGGSFVGAQAVQTLTALWLRDGKIKAADARLNSTVLDVSDKALRLVADVKGSHAKILYGQRGVTITETSIHAAKQLVEKIEKQREAGAATQLAVNRARQQVVTLEEELRRQRRELAKERRRLLELMGFASAADGWSAADMAAEEASDHEPSPPSTITEDVVVRLVATQRLDVAASRALVEAGAADLSVEERNRLKDLGLGVDFERDVDGKKTIGPTLDVPIPIFDSNQAQIAKAGSLARAALATHEAILQKGIREARTAYIDATEAAIAADEFRHNTLGGREDLSQRLHFNEQNAGAAFQAGEITLIDWLDVLRERQSAMQTLNDLRLDAALARIELEYAVGGRLEVPPTDSEGAGPASAPLDPTPTTGTLRR
ncbi:MAG: TolC family protein [Planctomycetes bacterium]|nr:TolC family protein [Planctomycetota bacterium]